MLGEFYVILMEQEMVRMMLREYYVVLLGQDTGENEDEEYLRSLVRSGEDRFFL